MPDAAFAKAPPSPNVEDRRDEHRGLTEVLISMGLLPQHPDQARRDALGLKDGEWFDEEGTFTPKPLSYMDTLAMDLGANDLDNQWNNRVRVQPKKIADESGWKKIEGPR